MAQNGKITAFTVSELIRIINGGKFTLPPPTKIEKILFIKTMIRKMRRAIKNQNSLTA